MGGHSGKGTKSLPDKYAALFGSVRVNRGTLSGDFENPESIKLAQWDAAPRCRREDCPSFHLCNYKAKSGRCKTFVYYIRNRACMYFDSLSYKEGNVRKSLISEPQWHEIGMKLIPLWCNLCRLKIELAGAPGLMYYDNKGNMRQHPLLKEQRETIWLITRLEKAVGLTPFLHVSSGVPPEVDLGEAGDDDSNWYEQLQSEDGPQIKRRIVKRKEKE